jgi:hypothetical protein
MGPVIPDRVGESCFMLLFDSIAASDPKLFQNPFSLCLPLLANSKFALLK